MDCCAFLKTDTVAASLHLLVFSLLFQYLPPLDAGFFSPSKVIWYSEVFVNV